LAHAPHGEGELHPERQAVKDRGERKADQRRGEGAAENDDEGMGVEEHRNVAAHEDEREQNDDTGNEADTGCNVHDETPPTQQARD
jgi:hypothetical protein